MTDLPVQTFSVDSGFSMEMWLGKLNATAHVWLSARVLMKERGAAKNAQNLEHLVGVSWIGFTSRVPTPSPSSARAAQSAVCLPSPQSVGRSKRGAGTYSRGSPPHSAKASCRASNRLAPASSKVISHYIIVRPSIKKSIGKAILNS